MNTDAILKRADELLAILDNIDHDTAQVMEAYHGTLNLLQVVHGTDGIQQTQLTQAMEAVGRAKEFTRQINLHKFVTPALTGALRSLRSDVAAGLTGNVAMLASGMELGDLLGLGKQALAQDGDGHKNVAAVLVAAAFEDTLRRLAELKAGLTDRPKLEEVVGKLKAAGVLAGAAVSTANSGLKFRNDSLHADWQHVDRVTIGTYLAFVEGLLLKHFS